MQPLMLHRECDAGPIRAVTATVRSTAGGCVAVFRLDGDIQGIVLPPQRPSVRTDDLWKTTCFEVFWQAIGESRYREFNLSASGQWAAYDFAEYRDKTGEVPIDAISLACSYNDRELILKASITADLPAPAQVSLSVVIENANGALQYWAMAFPPGKPDFHSEACRQIVVDDA